MKPYFFLLAVLYLSILAQAAIGVLAVPTPLALLKNLGDVACLGFSLWVAFDQAFDRARFDAAACRLAYRAAGACGIYAVVLTLTDTPYGPPGLFGPGLAHAAMVFMPYVLFIVPAVLAEKKRTAPEAGV